MHQFDTRAFSDMPLLIPEDVKKEVEGWFTKYLFITPGIDGKKNVFCTACGDKYEIGGLQRTQTPKDRALLYASHRSNHSCVHCGERCQVIERRRLKNLWRLNEDKEIIVFFSPNKNKVWYRCFFVTRRYGESDRREDICDWHEVQRFELSPGSARRYETYYNEWREVKFGEAFLWNHGLYTEKYFYTFVSGDGKLPKDTFLRYNSVDFYGGEKRYNKPVVKYMGWYAIHPQIEVLVKTGHSETVDEMIVKNTDSKRMLDWTKNTPWELHRLTKPVYRVWKEKCNGSVIVLKAFQKLKYTSEKEMLLAKDICFFCGYKLGEISALIKNLRKYDKSFKEFVKYLSSQVARVNRKRKKYLTNKREQYNQWVDYLRMAERLGMKNLSPFPGDLKTAHDDLIAMENGRKIKEQMEFVKKQAPATAAEILKRYPKTEKLLEKLKKYSYADGTYSIVIPEKVEDIVFDSMTLLLCTHRQDASGSFRYFERINRRESYIFFVRKNSDINTPWYQIEAEPGGTVRQKRTTGDEQFDKDMKSIVPFLIKWQEHLASILDDNDHKDVQNATAQRIKQYDALRKEGKKINYGVMAGKLLVDALEADLLEAKVG